MGNKIFKLSDYHASFAAYGVNCVEIAFEQDNYKVETSDGTTEGKVAYEYYLKDDEGFTYKLEYVVEYVDTTAPSVVAKESQGSQQSSVTYFTDELELGSELDIQELYNIEWFDNLTPEGDIRVDIDVLQSEGNTIMLGDELGKIVLNEMKLLPGSHQIGIVLTDGVGNSSEQQIFTLDLKERPKPVIQAKSLGNTSSASINSHQPLRSIRFHRTGVTIRYAEYGASRGQQYIDNNLWNATTWTLNSGPLTSPGHSNNDGRSTYFAAHASHAFQSAMYMQPGEQITIVDSSGNKQSYTVLKRVEFVQDDPHGARLMTQAQKSLINSYAGIESILLQASLNEASSRNAMTILLPS